MKNDKVLLRNEVPISKTWDTTKIYEDETKFNEDFEVVSNSIENLKAFKGILTKDGDTLKKALKLRDEVLYKLGHLHVYAHLNSDVDTADAHFQAMQSKTLDLVSKVYEAISYMAPELLEADETKIKTYLKDPELAIYSFEFEMLFREKPHILSAKEEALLAKAAPVLGASSQTFSVLNNADLKFPNIKDEDGNEVELSHGRYHSFMESVDRNVRKDAFKAMYETFGQLKNTFASTLSTTVKYHNFVASTHNFNSARHASLFSNAIDESVYDALLTAINDSLPLLHEYYALRKQYFGLTDLRMYDLALPMVKGVELKFTFDEARDLIYDALSVFGKEYNDVLHEAFENRWIDQLENKGKRSGAYSSGAYGTPPFILLNWQGTLDDVYTLIHELGHSMHSYYTRKYQPFIYGSYSIFLAEIASTTNENLLTAHLLNKYQDQEIRAYIINHFLDSVKSTIFRQTQFAEFEHEIHLLDQKGVALTSESMSKLYFDLNKKYYGDAITYDSDIQYEWARIPHFYYNYYVYQYATGFSCALAFSKYILEGGQEAIDKYIGYLKAGCSDYPMEVLKKAGVDMTTNKVTLDAMEIFKKRLNEFKELILK